MKALSVSELNLFYRERDKWFNHYVKGQPYPTVRAMEIGTIGHEWLEDNRYPLVKKLKEWEYDSQAIYKAKEALDKANKKAYPEKEKAFTAETKSGIKLIAKIDEYDPETHSIGDHKVTESDKDQYFTQWKLDDPNTMYSYYNQLSFYAWVYRIVFHRYPSNIRINKIWLKKGNCKTLNTNRGPKDIEYIASEAETMRVWCKKRGVWDKRMNRKQREELQKKEAQKTLID